MDIQTLSRSILTLRHIYKAERNYNMPYKKFYTLILLMAHIATHTEVYRQQLYNEIRFLGYDDRYWLWLVTDGYLLLDRIEKGKKIFKPTQKLYELISRLNETLKEVK